MPHMAPPRTWWGRARMGDEHEGTVVGRQGQDHEEVRAGVCCCTREGSKQRSWIRWRRSRTGTGTVPSSNLLAQLKQPPGRAVTTTTMIDQRKTRGHERSSDAQPVLQKAWAVSDDSCRQTVPCSGDDRLTRRDGNRRNTDTRNLCPVSAPRRTHAEPGFFEVDTVAHCGPALNGLLERVLRRHAHRPGVHHRDP